MNPRCAELADPRGRRGGARDAALRPQCHVGCGLYSPRQRSLDEAINGGGARAPRVTITVSKNQMRSTLIAGERALALPMETNLVEH